MIFYINSEKKSQNLFINLVGISINCNAYLSFKSFNNLLIRLLCDRLKCKSKFKICHAFISTSYAGMICIFVHIPF